MKKEEFILANAQIFKEIEALRQTRERLENEYIAANRRFQNGQKVLIRGKSIAFVTRAKIGFNNEIQYDFVKCKKDGTPSMISDYCSDHTCVEPLND